MPVPPQESTVFSERLDALFRTTRRPDGGEWKPGAVAAAIRKTGESVTGTYIDHLRSGRRRNPRMSLVQHLAELFAVPIGYFVDDPATDVTVRLSDPDQAPALADMRRLLRVASELDQNELRSVLEYAQRIADTGTVDLTDSAAATRSR